MRNYSKTGFIYIVKCGGAYKLGYSVLPEQRIGLIKTDNSKPVEVIGIWEHPEAYELEQLLLDLMYKDPDNDGFQHIRGEWYKIPKRALKELLYVLNEGVKECLR